MEPSYGRSDRNDDRNPWLPLIIVGGLIAVVFLVALIVFTRDDDTASPTGTLPTSFPDLTTTTLLTTPSTPPATPAATPPDVVVPTVRPATGGNTGRPTTTEVPSAADALTAFAGQQSATQSSDIVPIGSHLFAMIVSLGHGRLVQWDGRSWSVLKELQTSAAIRSVETADVTGDGTQDFIVTLVGLDAPAGVYSRATFQFEFLPFNTVTGKETFVDGLVYRNGTLQSPFHDTSGARTLIWTWTGQMFETG